MRGAAHSSAHQRTRGAEEAHTCGVDGWLNRQRTTCTRAQGWGTGRTAAKQGEEEGGSPWDGAARSVRATQTSTQWERRPPQAHLVALRAVHGAHVTSTSAGPQTHALLANRGGELCTLQARQAVATESIKDCARQAAQGVGGWVEQFANYLHTAERKCSWQMAHAWSRQAAIGHLPQCHPVPVTPFPGELNHILEPSWQQGPQYSFFHHVLRAALPSLGWAEMERGGSIWRVCPTDLTLLFSFLKQESSSSRF